MQFRMSLYLLLMLFLAFMTFVFLGIAFGFFSLTEDRLYEGMEQQLRLLTDEMRDELGRMEGYAHTLSARLGSSVEDCVGEYSTEISKLNNQPDKLLELQEEFYPELSSILQLSRGSGIYAVIDATTNTEAPGAEKSRSGVYLRLYNIAADYSLNPKFTCFRGIPELAREYRVELHNRWNMEFDTTNLPGFRLFSGKRYDKASEAGFWSNRLDLPDTWEDILLYSVPILGSDGRVYGECGIEMNELLFQMRHMVYANRSGSMIFVIAPLSERRLRMDLGLAGKMEGSSVRTDEALRIGRKGRFFRYYSEGQSFLGVQAPLPMRGEPGQSWEAAVLMPRSVYSDYVVFHRIRWTLAAAALLILMGIAAFFLSRSYVLPIRNSLDAFRNGGDPAPESGIPEIEELLHFVDQKLKEASIEREGIPLKIAELFDAFEERVGRLTAAEYAVFSHYVRGYDIPELPGLLYISINTVRKHNRSIYEKLNVASKDELMVYVELFRRCGRLEKLLTPKKHQVYDK